MGGLLGTIGGAIKGAITGGSGAGGLLSGASDIIDKFVQSPSDREAAKLEFGKELNRHLEAMANDAQAAYEAEVKDRDGARTRESEIVKAGGKNWTQNVLAYIGVISFFGIIAYVISKGLAHMSTEESFIVGNLIGMAGAIAKDIYGYYFGSSKQSREKDSTISEMAKK